MMRWNFKAFIMAINCIEKEIAEHGNDYITHRIKIVHDDFTYFLMYRTEVNYENRSM